jgi:transcriptional regulator with AAA-type ATPase domain/polyferredoxin
VSEQRLRQAAEAVGDRVAVGAGSVIVRQGEAGAAFYVVVSGALDVVVDAGEGVRLPVARLGPGTHFGEMSLLTESPVSADVVACEATTLLRVPAERFRRLVHDDPELLEHLAGELAARLRRTNEQLATQQQQQSALGRLLAAQYGCPFKADLPSLAQATAYAKAAQDDLPVLITGEGGVGKRALAQHLHAQSAQSERTILTVECADMVAEEARACLFGDAADPAAVTRFADRLGFLQAADGGTLVLADVDRLPLPVQADLGAFLASQPPPTTSPNVRLRLIATASRPMEQLLAEGALDAAFGEALAGGHVMNLRPLRKRRRDIVPLAEHFLAWVGRRRGFPPQELSESARRELQAYDFEFGNAAELLRVMELAGRLAEGGVVTAEHLFFGPGAEAEGPQLDLFRWPWIKGVVRSGTALKVLRAVVALSFFGIAVACILAPQHLAGRIGNILAWGVWWPGLVLSLILLGRVWCAVCPLSLGAEGVQRAAGRRLAPPDWLRRVGPVFALLGFVVIVWIEESTHMLSHPVRTGVLLLSLAAAAALIGLLYQRHTWCRYLCPLGAMGGVFSAASALRVSARREVCVASCTGHECFKGTEHSDGCPMFNHALYMTNGQYCKLCMRCLRDCPHDAPRLVLQPPLRDMWRSNLLSPDLVPLAVVIGMLVLFLTVTHTGLLSRPGGPLWFSLGCLAIAVLGVAITRLFRVRQRTGEGASIPWTARVIYAYAPAVAAILVAIRLHALPVLQDVSVGLSATHGSLVHLTLLEASEALVALAGGLMTLWALWCVCRLRFAEAPGSALVSWVGFSTLAVACLILAMSWLT